VELVSDKSGKGRKGMGQDYARDHQHDPTGSMEELQRRRELAATLAAMRRKEEDTTPGRNREGQIDREAERG
jgi:hypothetical protein